MKGNCTGNSNNNLAFATPLLFNLFYGCHRIYWMAGTDKSEVKTAPGPVTRWDWERHLSGVRMHGASPVGPDGKCVWGALDLDAHQEAIPERVPEAIELVRALEAKGITAYWKRSRGMRGAHVFVLFENTGVPHDALHAWLEEMARPLRAVGGVDVFPSGGSGRAKIFLPYFEGMAGALMSSDCREVSPDKLEVNPPAIVPALPPHQPKGPVPVLPIGELEVQGTRRPPWMNRRRLRSPANAEKGERAKVAIKAAVCLAKRGGGFEEFLAWDRGNRPPLATDEPETLRKLWRWAKEKVQVAPCR